MSILNHVIGSARWLVLALLLGTGLAHAEPLSAPEYKIKAAFLYNFAVLTEWPATAFETAKSPFKIGIVGKDPFGRLLEETMRGKTVHGRKIVIERFKPGEDRLNCHLLFICLSEEENVKAILASLDHQPVLTVSEIDRFNYQGGALCLKKQNDEVKFRVRMASVRQNGLTLSSKMLSLSINARSKKEGSQ